MFTKRIIPAKIPSQSTTISYLKEIDTNIHISANYLLEADTTTGSMSKFSCTTHTFGFAIGNIARTIGKNNLEIDNITLTFNNITFVINKIVLVIDNITLVFNNTTFVIDNIILVFYNIAFVIYKNVFVIGNNTKPRTDNTLPNPCSFIFSIT